MGKKKDGNGVRGGGHVKVTNMPGIRGWDWRVSKKKKAESCGVFVQNV